VVTAFNGDIYPADIIYVDPLNELALLRTLIPIQIPASLPL